MYIYYRRGYTCNSKKRKTQNSFLIALNYFEAGFKTIAYFAVIEQSEPLPTNKQQQKQNKKIKTKIEIREITHKHF